MELTAEQQDMAAGRMGPTLQWAIVQQLAVGTFFQAGREDLDDVYARYFDPGVDAPRASGTDLVVFSAPQLSLYELIDVV